MTSTLLLSESVSNLSHLDKVSALATDKPTSSVSSELNSPVFDHSDQDALRDPHPWATRIDRFTGLPMYPPYFRNPPSPTTTTESVTTASESSIESIDEVQLPPVVGDGRKLNISSVRALLKRRLSIVDFRRTQTDLPQTHNVHQPEEHLMAHLGRDGGLDPSTMEQSQTLPESDGRGESDAAGEPSIRTPADEDALLRNPVEFVDFTFLQEDDEEGDDEEGEPVAETGPQLALDHHSRSSSPASVYVTPAASRSQTPDHTSEVVLCPSPATVFVTAPSSPTSAPNAHAGHSGPMLGQRLPPCRTVDYLEEKTYYPLWSSCDTWTVVWCSLGYHISCVY